MPQTRVGDNPDLARLACFLGNFRGELEAILEQASALADPTLANSVRQMLQMKIYEISSTTTAELRNLQTLQTGDLPEAEADLTSQAIHLYVAMRLFVTQLYDCMRESANPDRGRRHAAADAVSDAAEGIGKMAHFSERRDNFICRICEEVVPLDLVEEHSSLCLAAHQLQYQSFCATEKLNRALTEISHGFLDHPFPAAGVPSRILFPCLYIYLVVQCAAEIRSSDVRPDELLEQLNVKVHNFSFPRGVLVRPELLGEISQSIVNKFTAIRGIASAVKQILRTTRKRRASLNGFETSLADFDFAGRISSGAFARVYLARKKKTQDLYAIKVIKRSHVNLKNQVRKVSIERDIMMKLNNRFMVHFYYSFMRENNLYLVMEYLPGGDIYSVLQELGALPEDAVRTYCAQIVKALGFLRDMSIIHRDLKPENILIDEAGMLKLVDFGLSFDSMSGVARPSKVGTPDYMAPEIVLMQPHSFSADYWSLGVIVYEMLTGETPFNSDDVEQTFRRIVCERFDQTLLDDFSEECRDFVFRLLEVSPTRRLGAECFRELMEHPWFEGIDWANLHKGEPVFVPDTAATDAYKRNFQDRYRFALRDESDILEDIQTCKGTIAASFSDGKMRLLEGTDRFESIALHNLASSNTDRAEKIRRALPTQHPISRSHESLPLLPSDIPGVSPLLALES
jgi:serine/threonine protein kinase